MSENKVPQINKDLCIGCGVCVTSCPNQVLELKDNKANVAKPENCKQIKACVQVCPVAAITI